MCKKNKKTKEGSCILHSCSPLVFYSISLELPTLDLISTAAEESERNQKFVVHSTMLDL